MGTYESDTYVGLRDRERVARRRQGRPARAPWTAPSVRHSRGSGFAFTQPIQMRLDEAETGITTDVGVKIIGTNPDTLADCWPRGWSTCWPGRARGGRSACHGGRPRIKQVRLELDREMMARATGSAAATWARRWSARSARRWPPRWWTGPGASASWCAWRAPRRIDPALFRPLPIASRGGAVDPPRRGGAGEAGGVPEAYAHEGGQRLVVVGANIRGRDVVGFVDDARCPARQRRCRCPGLPLRVGRPVHPPAARRSSRLGDPGAARHPGDLPAALRRLPARAPGGAGDVQRAVRARGRRGGALDDRAQPEPVGVDRLHRAVRHRGAQRRGDGHVDQRPARTTARPLLEATHRGRREPPAPGAHDGAGGRLRLRADGDLALAGRGSAAAAGHGGDRRAASPRRC